MTKMLLATLLTIGAVGSAAAFGPEITYQGVLSDGPAAPSGLYDFEFLLYDAETGGMELSPGVVVDDHTVTDGVFTVTLDFGAPFNDSDSAWLEIRVREGASVDPYTTLNPRQLLTAVPFAHVANSVAVNGVSGASIADQSVTADDLAAGSVGLSEIKVTEVQRRVTGTCPPDQYIAEVNQNGTVACAAPTMTELWQLVTDGIGYGAGRVGVGTTAPEFDLHVNGEFFVNSSLGRINFGSSGDGSRWRWSTQGGGANLRLQSKESGSNTNLRRMYWHQNGNVAVGDNSNPDEEFVVGTNLGSTWANPAITVGGAVGGALEIGNPDYGLALTSGSNLSRARIIASSPVGFGRGEIEMRTNGLAIGENDGPPGDYRLKVTHGSFGVNLARVDTDNDWELLTSSAAASNLNLYANGAFRGVFSGVDGTYSATSDRRFKTDVRALEPVMTSVLNLKASRYKCKDNNPEERESIGFIAQDIQALFPELVTTINDERTSDTLAVNYSGLSVVSIRAIQEQQGEIEALRDQVAALTARLDSMEHRP